jgi:hypothetical protein
VMKWTFQLAWNKPKKLMFESCTFLHWLKFNFCRRVLPIEMTCWKEVWVILLQP